MRPLRLTQIGRVVHGQVYSYHNHAWYRETGQTAVDMHIPDPRPMLAELSPSARFVRVGTAIVDGVRVEHLQATALAALPAISVWFMRQPPYGHISSLHVWVDDHSVVRRLAWSVDAPTWTQSSGKKVIASGGHMEESTVVTFRAIGQPQVINVPANAIPVRSPG